MVACLTPADGCDLTACPGLCTALRTCTRGVACRFYQHQEGSSLAVQGPTLQVAVSVPGCNCDILSHRGAMRSALCIRGDDGPQDRSPGSQAVQALKMLGAWRYSRVHAQREGAEAERAPWSCMNETLGDGLRADAQAERKADEFACGPAYAARLTRSTSDTSVTMRLDGPHPASDSELTRPMALGPRRCYY